MTLLPPWVPICKLSHGYYLPSSSPRTWLQVRQGKGLISPPLQPHPLAFAHATGISLYFSACWTTESVDNCFHGFQESRVLLLIGCKRPTLLLTLFVHASPCVLAFQPVDSSTCRADFLYSRSRNTDAFMLSPLLPLMILWYCFFVTVTDFPVTSHARSSGFGWNFPMYSPLAIPLQLHLLFRGHGVDRCSVSHCWLCGCC